ncbi:hypothetical protein BD626DRAFT_509617 [Schizophyllum amplum]|uniref:Uncharacterized protein n=1 Tax=Schizophyllum amplum TaxID=97359 RepID=A0A550C2R3_9AGAR|nr:hypothetical protein BD626DRAFT_509617 [Auriculariopsis ampla]
MEVADKNEIKGAEWTPSSLRRAMCKLSRSSHRVLGVHEFCFHTNIVIFCCQSRQAEVDSAIVPALELVC